MLPDALAAVQINQRSSATQWRDAASRIAYEATIAWQHAGRMEVGINVNSPLVSLVQDILACAGVERARKTIANALGSDRPSNKTQNKDSIRGSAAAAE
jgi:hypothetical protein